jgi:hypothetical protein
VIKAPLRTSRHPHIKSEYKYELKVLSIPRLLQQPFISLKMDPNLVQYVQLLEKSDKLPGQLAAAAHNLDRRVDRGSVTLQELTGGNGVDGAEYLPTILPYSTSAKLLVRFSEDDAKLYCLGMKPTTAALIIHATENTNNKAIQNIFMSHGSKPREINAWVKLLAWAEQEPKDDQLVKLLTDKMENTDDMDITEEPEDSEHSNILAASEEESNMVDRSEPTEQIVSVAESKEVELGTLGKAEDGYNSDECL